MFFGFPIFVSVCKISCLHADCGVVLFNSFWITDIYAITAVLCPTAQFGMAMFMFCHE
jgi:hypothetical protein